MSGEKEKPYGYCRECGAPFYQNDTFCSECGHDLSKLKKSITQSKNSSQRLNSSKKKRTSSRMQKSGKKDRKRSLWY